MIVSVHLPKTAGTSFKKSLIEYFHKKDIALYQKAFDMRAERLAEGEL